jgi:hypothetical protein
MPYPRVIPHSDGSSTVEAVGEGVSGKWIGRRVWCCGAQSYRLFGTAAEYAVVPVLRQHTPVAVGAKSTSPHGPTKRGTRRPTVVPSRKFDTMGRSCFAWMKQHRVGVTDALPLLNFGGYVAR